MFLKIELTELGKPAKLGNKRHSQGQLRFPGYKDINLKIIWRQGHNSDKFSLKYSRAEGQ